MAAVWPRQNIPTPSNPLPDDAVSGERDAMRPQHAREPVAGQVSEFALALRRQRIEPFEFGIDEARMAHHHALRRQILKEARKQPGKIRFRRHGEVVSAGERRIGADAARCGKLAMGVISVSRISPLGPANMKRGRSNPVAYSSILKPAGSFSWAPSGRGTTCERLVEDGVA